jgi:putative membrane protein
MEVTMKLLGGSLVCALALSVACNGNNARTDRDDDDYKREQPSVTVGTSGQTEHGADADARHFAESAIGANAAEVKLGQLAAQKAQNAQVKQFAQMMVADHTKAGNELKQAVKSYNVNAPTTLDAKHQALYDRLSKMSGAAFDREYMSAMVDGHREVKSMVAGRADDPHKAHTAGTSGKAGGDSALDGAVNQWATKALPTVEHHLQQAEQIHGSLK